MKCQNSNEKYGLRQVSNFSRNLKTGCHFSIDLIIRKMNRERREKNSDSLQHH
jgi:ATP-dependent RNA circularization protein (DNA/RNA ligase family)